MQVTYRAPKGTEVSTTLRGKEVRFFFDDGTYSTTDDDLIELLHSLAGTPGHPITQAKEK